MSDLNIILTDLGILGEGSGSSGGTEPVVKAFPVGGDTVALGKVGYVDASGKLMQGSVEGIPTYIKQFGISIDDANSLFNTYNAQTNIGVYNRINVRAFKTKGLSKERLVLIGKSISSTVDIEVQVYTFNTEGRPVLEASKLVLSGLQTLTSLSGFEAIEANNNKFWIVTTGKTASTSYCSAFSIILTENASNVVQIANAKMCDLITSGVTSTTWTDYMVNYVIKGNTESMLVICRSAYTGDSGSTYSTESIVPRKIEGATPTTSTAITNPLGTNSGTSNTQAWAATVGSLYEDNDQTYDSTYFIIPFKEKTSSALEVGLFPITYTATTSYYAQVSSDIAVSPNLCKLNSSSYVITWLFNSVLKACVITLSGTTITVGTKIDIATGVSSYYLIPKDETTFYTFVVPTSINEPAGTYKLTVAAAALILGNFDKILPPTEVTKFKYAYEGEHTQADYYLGFVQKNYSPTQVFLTKHQTPSREMPVESALPWGIILKDGVKGDSVSLQLAGDVSGMVGLKPGFKYYTSTNGDLSTGGKTYVGYAINSATLRLTKAL